MILGNSRSLVILVFSIIIYPKTKLQGVRNVKKLNLKLVINLINLKVLGVYLNKKNYVSDVILSYRAQVDLKQPKIPKP